MDRLVWDGELVEEVSHWEFGREFDWEFDQACGPPVRHSFSMLIRYRVGRDGIELYFYAL